MKAALITALFSALLLAGCTSSEKKAAELLETARFEEKQSNREHAQKLYQEIISKYPDSAAAKDAAGRMNELKQTRP